MSSVTTIPETILRAERLVKRFGDVTAVNELSLEVREGEILALLGPNGAGKTVTISMLCGLLKADRGNVYFRSQSLDKSARGIIGFCPQNIIVWPKLTCYEQLTFIGKMYDLPSQACQHRATELLEDFHLMDKRNKLASTLSGGMQRRLNLALALMHDPQLLVLDEPEAGLDPQSRVLVREYIHHWADIKGRTVLLTTQNMDEAERMADRVAIIDHGSLLKLDTPEILKHNIGQGDILEINLGENHELSQIACQEVKKFTYNVSLQNGSLVVRTLGAVELLPAVIQAIKTCGIIPGEIRLHHNSLEDVFIALTGKRLRE
jgi:ABC-2 type transport system ATP-binding protein